MSHPLHTAPRCLAEDLGEPIPDSPHAVSVCLPTWRDVIGYEEKDPRVTSRLRTGYPRFFLHPLIERVRRELRPGEGRDALPFAGRAAAEECAAMAGGKALEVDGIHAAYFPAAGLPQALACWQHAGRGLSSRAAAEWLECRRACGTDEALAATIRDRLASWSGADPDMVGLHPSGMAAIHTAFRAVTARRPGCGTVMFGFPYTDTLKILRKFGSGGVDFFATCGQADLDRLGELLATKRIAGIFCEFPGNPLLQCPDLPALHTLARRHGVPVVVDDTIGTAFNVDVLPHADFVATSLTKAVSGEGDVMAGALTFHPGLDDLALPPCEDFLHHQDLGVLERNSRDFAARMRVCNANALSLARLLDSHPAVARVWYPGLGPCPAYEALRKPGGGHGTVLSFLPHDAPTVTPRIFERLRVNRGISLGTSYTLACPYVQLAHYHELDWARSCGIDPHLLRVSAGMESLEDLEARFRDALA